MKQTTSTPSLRYFSYFMILGLIFMGVMGNSAAYSQVDTKVQNTQDLTNKIKTLNQLMVSSQALKAEIEQTKKQREEATSKKEKESYSNIIEALSLRLENSSENFSKLVTGIDTANFLAAPTEDEVKIEKEVQLIFTPIVNELKRATERPRYMEKLRTDIYFYNQQLEQIQDALAHIDSLKQASKAPDFIKKIEPIEKFWKLKKRDLTTNKTLAEQQLLSQKNETKSFSETSSAFFKSFFKERGRNLALAFSSFLILLLFFRFLFQFIVARSPLHTSDKRIFLRNLFNLSYNVITFLLAIGVLLAILFSSGDWLLLGVIIIFLAASIWKMSEHIPAYLEQIKLLLNFGPVRKGERLTYNGIDWRVDSIGFHSYLHNPLLTGGTIRLPLKDLIGLRSRVNDEREPWFPTKEGDDILLNGDWRAVSLQTPQVVQFNWFGMEEILPTASFLSQKMFNLSRVEKFWVGVTVDFAYKERHNILKNVIPTLETAIEKGFQELASFKGSSITPWIDLWKINHNSFSVMIWVQLDSNMAKKFVLAKIEMEKITLRVANENNWDVSHTQPVELRNTHPNNLTLETQERNISS